MKKLHLPITCLFVLIWMTALAQPQPAPRSDIPMVPATLTFAGLMVQIDEGARSLIQQDVNALMANRQYWDMKLNRTALYFPIMEKILAEESVPLDFKYLAVQESSLTPDAVSTSMAVGYWQFKRETALDHGLRVDDEIDERKSITASTRGAARYLKRTNAIYNNWISALYSYYLGAGGVSRLIPPDWTNARQISVNTGTDRYILRCFAHKIAIENAMQTFKPSNLVALVEYSQGNGKQLSQIAQELQVDEFEVRKYNRWIAGDAVPTDKSYVMTIPIPNDKLAESRKPLKPDEAEKKVVVARSQPVDDLGFPVLRRITPTGAGRNEPIFYEINGLNGIQAQAGDTPMSLSKKARVSLASFLRYNDMSEREPVITGEVYYLEKKRRKGMVPYHTVRENETLRAISHMYNVRMKKLLRYNRLDRIQKLQVGRVMWLRKRRPNNPVEIINTPSVPAATPQTSVIAQNENTGTTPAPPRTNTNDIPRNASERKVYQPKLVDAVDTPASPQRSPETLASRPVNQVSNRPSPTTTPPNKAPENTTTPSTTAVPTATPASGTTNQRVIIVRPAEEDLANNSAPVSNNTPAPTSAPTTTMRPATTPANTVKEPASRPIPSTPEPKTTYSRPVPPTETSKPATPSGTATHTVEPGQTYYSISRLYNLTVDQLLALNNLTASDKLAVGQQLTVRAAKSGSFSRPASPAVTPSGSAPVQYHTVLKGETMYRISKQYGVTIEQIQEWNQLSDVTVKEGQRIKIVK